MRIHPDIEDCGVVGLPDEEWGEVVAAVLVLKNVISKEEINAWLRERLPGYKVPRLYQFVEELPRNAMGKVTKNDLKIMF